MAGRSGGDQRSTVHRARRGRPVALVAPVDLGPGDLTPGDAAPVDRPGRVERARAAARSWWEAPATLEVLVEPERYVREVVAGFFRFGVAGVVVGLPTLMITSRSPLSVTVAAAAGLCFCSLAVLPPGGRRGRGPLFVLVAAIASVVGWWVGTYSSSSSPLVVVVPAAVSVVAVWLPPRWAALAVTTGSIAYLTTLVVRDVDHVLGRFLPVLVFSFLTLHSLTWMLRGVRGLSEELADLNRTLEDRVQEQVGEIEGLGRLRQFLPSQVAEAVLADSLAPHRCQIAVVFSDLRGFTGFSNSSEPEELLDVLAEYYEVVGAELRAHAATAGSFQGDGIMAYFNDPVPCDDPAGTAVAMALALRAGLDDLAARWHRRGFDLGWGIGIAYGYATLGTIGFEGRSDYTPLGPVVNLAARLCDEAGRGEILLDGRAHNEVEGRVSAEPRAVALKGYDSPVAAFRI